MQLRSAIAALRGKAGLTQLELSRRIGVTETTVANWEKGRSGLEWFDRVIKLCWELNCVPEDLIKYVPEIDSPEIGAEDGALEGFSFTEMRKILSQDRSKDLSFTEMRNILRSEIFVEGETIKPVQQKNSHFG